MSVFQVFRTFHHSGDPNIFTESVAIFSSLEIANMFIQEEIENKSYYKHIETYVVEVVLDKVYINTMQNKKLLSKRF